MASEAFIVDRKLGAIQVSRLLDVRMLLRDNGETGLADLPTTGRPVLEGGQALQPDVLYPHDRNPALRYYLPNYRVSAGQNRRPDVQLQFREGPGGEVGRLVVTLAWTPPAAPAGTRVLVMDHLAALSLRYRIGVQGVAALTAANASAWEQSVALQPLQPQSGEFLSRSTTVFTDKSQFDIVYQAMRDPARGAMLDIFVTAPLKVRTWRQVLIGNLGLKEQETVLQMHGGLFTETLHRESLATVSSAAILTGARVTLAPPPAAATAHVEVARAALVEPAVAIRFEEGAQLHARAFAPRVAMAQPRVAMRPAAMAAAAAPRVAMAQPRAAGAAPAAGLRAAAFADVAMRADAAPAFAAAAARPAPAVAARLATDRVSATTMARVNSPKLSQAVADSDFRIDGRKAVPIKVALGKDKQPVTIDSEVQNAQAIAFTFDPSKAENDGVFSGTGTANDQIHLLLALQLAGPDGAPVVVYQDNLMPDIVYVAPSEFRLQRDETAPFLPAISFLATEFSTTDNDQDAEVLCRVTAVYRLEPWLDPKVLDLARAALAVQQKVARFTTVPTGGARLKLLLRGNAEEEQADAKIDAISGIADTLEFDYATFLGLWRERLAVPNVGITGHVDYSLFDGSKASVPVRLSLFEESADLFDVALLGPVANAPGRYTVSVRNRVESPARITALPADIVPGGVARPVDADAVIGQVLQPQETRRIDYDVGATTPPLLTFAPTILGRAETNLAALLKMLLVTPGYSSLGFSLTVKVPVELFAASAPGTEALTGLIVEFDDGTRATLSGNAPQAEVTLVGRLADRLLGNADVSQRYFYRVTNLHPSGEGARTAWREGQGTAPLTVGAAVVTLDF